MWEPIPIGPGLWRAETAEMSSNSVGFICLSRVRMPEPSSWKTPSVSARWRSSKVLPSSRPTSSILTGGLLLYSMFFRVSSIVVRFDRPRKSIFRIPSSSHSGYSNWVIVAPSEGRFMIGMTSMRGAEDMSTAQACTPHWRVSPSNPLASSKARPASASSARRLRKSPAST